LTEVGATAADIVRLNTYVADYRPEDAPLVAEANLKLFDGATPASATLLGVQSLFAPDCRCEVEATAVVKS
jgi:enamine deaminase RidA (YjgF/YER057c/UK114 family)